jgi:hypothetical protein
MFQIGLTKQNKPCIILDRYKYRKDKVLTNRDISWRCMGPSCKASLRTNSEISNILLHKSVHTGIHPPSTVVPLSVMPDSPATGSPSHTQASCIEDDTSGVTLDRRLA